LEVILFKEKAGISCIGYGKHAWIHNYHAKLENVVGIFLLIAEGEMSSRKRVVKCVYGLVGGVI
jgi:hypothetical protein